MTPKYIRMDIDGHLKNLNSYMGVMNGHQITTGGLRVKYNKRGQCRLIVWRGTHTVGDMMQDHYYSPLTPAYVSLKAFNELLIALCRAYDANYYTLDGDAKW